MTRAFLDTNIFVYALGGPHPYRGPCRAILELLQRRDLDGEISVEVAQEFLHVRGRRASNRRDAPREAREVMAICHRVHDLQRRDLELAIELLESDADLNARDAVYAATAANRGIGSILSADRVFDRIAGLRRIDPADAAGVERLID